jgi:ornithine carbamoyltransferase
VTRHFRDLTDLGAEGLARVLDRAAALKRLRGTPDHPRPLAGKTVAVLLEKASTRTRISFEVGIHELGGYPLTLAARDTQLGRGEPLEDTARMLSRYCHAAVYRTHGHDRIEALAGVSTIPIVNGLSDTYHPCQLLADLQTVREHVRPELEGVRVVWVGDGNNMAHSWILAAGLTGLDLTIASPEGYLPDEDVVARGRALGGGRIEVTCDPDAAIRGADVVTTDVWASMGQEGEANERRAAFSGFGVTAARMATAAPGAIFLHCLPAHRGEEVDAEVMDGPASRVWDEAENRLHAQKALLEDLLGEA